MHLSHGEEQCQENWGSLHSRAAPWGTGFPAQDAFRSFSLPSRDLKPTNILLGDEGQPILMDLGSMSQACIQVEGSRQALALQVRESPDFFGHLLPIPKSF